VREPSGGDQEGERERTVEEASKNKRWHQNRGVCITLGRVWRVPVYWPGGVRREDGASLICGYYTKRGKACADTVLAPRTGAGARGSAPSSRNCEASSTDADALADQLVVVMKHL